MGPLLLLAGVLLMGVTLFSLFCSCRLQSRIYRAMKAGELVDVGQNGRKLFLSDGIALVSWWLASLTGRPSLTVSAALLLLGALLKTLIFFVLSGICVWYMMQYSKKQQS